MYIESNATLEKYDFYWLNEFLKAKPGLSFCLTTLCFAHNTAGDSSAILSLRAKKTSMIFCQTLPLYIAELSLERHFIEWYETVVNVSPGW